VSSRTAFRAALLQPWWLLSPWCRVIAIALVAMADDNAKVTTTYERLRLVTRASNATIHRALTALQKAGFCVIDSRSGRRGETTLTLQSGTLIGTFPDERGGTFTDQLIQQLATGTDPAIFRSSSSDLRGSQITAHVDQTRTQTNARNISPKRSAAEKIHARAWAAADYLRKRILAEQPASILAAKPWSETPQSGARLSWAKSFDQLHSRLCRAAKDQPEAAVWEEIARTVKWLFDDQLGDQRFVVLAPDTLARKWDAIQLRRKASQTRSARGSDGRPDPAAARTFTRLGEEHGDG
jgi:hypothetical protein